MNLEALQALSGIQATGAATQEGPTRLAAGQAAPQSFGSMVTDGLSRLNGELLASQAEMQELAVGNVQNLHQVMIRMEESRLSFELMLHVRNRVLEAYQDLMKMQV
jgi:flagellar hook-basal body complex protein FliE